MKRILCSAVILSLFSCESGSSSGPSTQNVENGGGDASGAITFPNTPCTAKFTEDYAVKDYFGDAKFSVKKGEEFVLKSWASEYGKREVSLYKVAGGIYYEFDVLPKTENGTDHPLEYSCEEEKAQVQLVALADFDFYSDEEATVQVCSVKKGALLSASGGGFQYESGQDTYSIYNLWGKVEGEDCDAEELYFKAFDVEVMGTSITYVPMGFYYTQSE